MATSHPVETPVESDVDIDEAVKQILAEMEVEEQDPLEGMGNAQVAEIYHRMTPEDQRLFWQFKRFHKRYYETHGHDAPKPPADSRHRSTNVPRATIRRR